MLRDVLGFRAAEVAEMLNTTEASVNSLLRRARAAFETRLPAAGRERAPLPSSKRLQEVLGRFADAVEAGDIDGMVALLTDDAWLSMPPEPHEYQGPAAIGVFLRGREVSRGRMRLVPTRANGQPAFGCYLSSPQTEVARAYACSSSSWRATGSPRSPGSPTAASSRSSACRGCCGRSCATRARPYESLSPR